MLERTNENLIKKLSSSSSLLLQISLWIMKATTNKLCHMHHLQHGFNVSVCLVHETKLIMRHCQFVVVAAANVMIIIIAHLIWIVTTCGFNKLGLMWCGLSLFVCVCWYPNKCNEIIDFYTNEKSMKNSSISKSGCT